ncbi:MAG: hypothetical protein E7049_05500 [Lentisphaerae bacterium]|nr:hypothetical protein [Lentisphaerota bacterium]
MKIVEKLVFVAMMVVACGCAGLGGRRGAPVENVEGCTVELVGDKSMKNVVMLAAHRKLWLPQALEDGKVRCTLNLRGHQVVVDVVYEKSSFSIRYVSSENMNYDPATNTINPKYNQWVRNLQREIVGQALK